MLDDDGGGIGRIYGQEKNVTTYNLARMKMLLHGVKDIEFEIFHGDTLTNDWDMLRETNPARMPRFDAVVANPPFSYRWQPNDTLADDVRFKNHGLAPKSAADFAFLLHDFHYLADDSDDGDHRAAWRAVPGWGGKGNPHENAARRSYRHCYRPAGKTFFSTGIPVCILVLKKCKRPDDVLFINAELHFGKGERQSHLRPEDIRKVISTYQDREETDRYSRHISMEEIAGNDYNLNITRYVSTAESEEEIDLVKVQRKLAESAVRIGQHKAEHNAFLKELGLAPLP